MFKADNNKNLVLEIRLFEPKCIMPFNEFLNKSKDKRPYYNLMR